MKKSTKILIGAVAATFVVCILIVVIASRNKKPETPDPTLTEPTGTTAPTEPGKPTSPDTPTEPGEPTKPTKPTKPGEETTAPDHSKTEPRTTTEKPEELPKTGQLKWPVPVLAGAGLLLLALGALLRLLDRREEDTP